MTTPRSLHDLYAEMERLLAIGQAPWLAALLRERFLRIAIAQGERAWAAYGFPVALSLAEKIARLPFTGVSLDVVGRIEETLTEATKRDAPPWPGASRWRETAQAAIARLRQERTRALAGLSAATSEAIHAAADSGTDAVTVRVPVVVELSKGAETHPLFTDLRLGLLLELKVEAHAEARSGKCVRLVIDGNAPSDVRSALEASLKCLDALSSPGVPRLGQCWFRASWRPSEARLTGKSAMLPLVLAAAAARARLSAGLADRGLAPDTAFTGELGVAGSGASSSGARSAQSRSASRTGTVVLPVEASSLPHKVEACFFSSVRTLVVPQEQQAEAVAAVRALESRYPGRQLLIRGAHLAEDLWRDSTIVLARPRNARQVAGAAFSRFMVSRGFVGAMCLLVAVAVTLGAREMWLSRDDPAVAGWQGEDLVVTNASGRECWRKHLPPGPRDRFPTYSLGTGAQNVAVWNLDGKGPQEVIAVVFSQQILGDRLVAWNRHGQILWTRPSNEWPLVHASGLPNVYWRCFAGAGRLPSGEMRLIAMRRSVQEPLSLVDVLDGASGRRVFTLRGEGHVEVIDEADLDGDGLLELCLCGQDNGTNHGVFAVLNTEALLQCSPSASAARMEGDEPLWDNLAQIPSLTDPRALQAGETTAIRFPCDRFLCKTRPTCSEIRMEGRGTTRAAVYVSSFRAVNYLMRFSRLDDVRMLSVRIGDRYREELIGLGRTMEEILAEEARLTNSVEMLTPDGWKAVEVEASASLPH